MKEVKWAEMFCAVIETIHCAEYQSPDYYYNYNEARQYLDEQANNPDFKSGTVEKHLVPVEVNE